MSTRQKRAMPAQAMLLAAGEGTRLRPLTDHFSKCMVPIGGQPVLAANIDWLRSYGVIDLVVNLHHAPGTVIEHFGDGSRFGVRIKYSIEPELLGTAGAVKRVAEFFDGPFFVWYGDNLSTCRLDELWEFHVESRSVATIAVHEREDPTGSGIVGMDARGCITRFLEKPRPEQVFSNWVSAGIFVLERQVLDSIPDTGPADFGRDVFPALLEQGLPLGAYRLSDEERLWWIDTPRDLARVEQEFSSHDWAVARPSGRAPE